MGQNARISVQEYSWENSIQNLLNIWQEEIDRRITIDAGQLSTSN